ncbi:hypothetical protein Zmor_004720 [Zophobas morio]|uniref:E3 SUMO-protein ligase RanBP2 n=1 Tax=Zophobas morio TaxID=2755281 RepID=A0AA38ML99_9CUCU|nr:hypothetical protein Zmor_004720 [Zophobas morio]
MFPTNKADVDRHVEDSLKKINNETERNLRCFSFAKQYFKIQRYEEARRYVSTYLSARPNSAEAHCLLAKCLEGQGKKEAALQAYTTSLRLDPKQNSLVLKVCELLASDDVEMDQSGARYFCEMAQSFDPHNPAIFNLKQRILTINNDDPREVTNLILKELETRPTDVSLRVRLLKHLMHHRMVKEAYKHAAEIESKDLSIFHNNMAWYQAVAEVLVKYQRTVSLPNSLGWEFWFLSVSILDKLVSLSLEENTDNIKPTTEYVNALFNFDQTLAKAALNVADCPDKYLVQEFLNHYSSELCFHLATLVFKQAKKEFMNYKEAANISLPLLFASYHSHPPDLQSMWFNHAPEHRRNLVRRWRREAAFRCSQSGHILQAAAKDRKSIVIEKANQYSMGMWREQLFKKLFITRDQQQKMKTSYFLADQKLLDITIRLPDASELLKYDEEAQLNYPDSLHHHIWIGLNNKLSDFKCTVFDGLQYSIKNLKNCGAETLNVLDLQAFIYCATLCSKFNLESSRHISSYHNVDKPNVLPAAVTPELGTAYQKKFFAAAYKTYKNEYDPAVDQQRLTLIDGIRVVRCVDNGLDVKLLVVLAQTFADRAKGATKQSEIEFNEARAELYWKAALPILEKMKNNQAVSYPPNKFFDHRSKEMALTEVCGYIETGKLFSGTQLMKKKDYEKALRVFEALRDPYASFYQAQIYKQLADQQTSQSKENVTSEMRSQYIILLSRARDCLYLTLDRLREPSVDQKHPLNEQLGTEIEKIERLLSRIDPDCTNRNECDGMSDENVSSADSAGEHYVTGYSAHNSSYFNGVFSGRNDHNHSTPYRSDLFKREAKPSPERLDAQLRQLTASKDAAINHILENNKIMVESHRTLVEELRSFKEVVNNLTSTVDELKNMKHGYEDLKDIKKTVSELKASIDDLDGFKNVSDMVFEMKKEIAELKKDVNKTSQLSEEDIYGLANEYGAEYNLNSNLAAYNSNLYQNYQRMPGATSLYGPPPLYPGMYPMAYGYGLGLPQTSGLQFGTEQPIPGISGQDFRAISAALSQVQPSVTYAQTTQPQTNLGLLAAQGLTQTPKVGSGQMVYPTIGGVAVTTTPTTKAPPVNVVITASDPLPSTKTTTSQPILSVTIPPQHLKGNIPKAQPHNYQIPLPVSAVANTSPSVLSKPPPTVSTQSILSNVAPPVYSAVSDKTPLNVSLGLQIEKTLEQTFNSSKNETLNKSSVSTSSVEEHDPCPDFKPIIPLPDEVPVTTGEESETVLFCERAKLFRYVAEVKEWKERGIGTLKILKNPETKKVRILMRRDQVLKICANHFLTKEMVLTPMAKSDRAYIWAAHDYADEEVVLEKLCVRFKTADEAKKFVEAFESAKRDLGEEKVGVSATSTGSTLGGFVFSTTPTFKPKQEAVMVSVSVPEPQKESPFAGFSFGGTKSGGFPTFQTNFTPVKPTETVSSTTKPRKASDDESDDFVPTAEFKPVVPLPELVEVKTGEENAEVLFEHKAKLLRLDTSGETKEWKEKGVGIFKVLRDNIVRLVMRRDQVLKVCCNHQLLKNMDFKLMSNNANAVTWCAKDFSEGVVKPETLCVRFKTDDLAAAFLKAVNTAKETLDDNHFVVAKQTEKHAKTESPAKLQGFGDKFKPVKGSWSCKNCYVMNEGKANYCIACETPKNDSLPKKSEDASGAAFSFGVANMTAVTNSWGSAFKPKEGSWECKTCYIFNDAERTHCASCESPKDDTVPKKETPKGVNLDTGGLKFNFGIQPVKVESAEPPKPKVSGWGDLFKPKAGSWECKHCMVQNTGDVVHCLACDNPKDESVPKKEPKGLGSDAQKYTFGFPPATTQAASAKATFTFGQSTISTTKPDTPFVFKPQVTIAPEKKDPGAEKFVFGSPQKHDFEFTPRSPRRISSGTKDEESDASYVEEEVDNIYFKPVIPLPDKVEVKTGEEEEDALYCHRAKLYRFVDKEWKERGIGDIKVLRRKDTGKLRVLMRREQVFKICLNHILTTEIKYLPKDDKSWLFCAADFSEGELVNEQFCVRFKNAEVAQEFMKAVNDALNEASSDTGKESDEKTDDSEVEFVSETKVTPEEEKEALRLGLPAKFLSYRQLPDCQCDQCKKDDLYLKDFFNQRRLSKPSSTDSLSCVSDSSSTSSIFATPRGDILSFKTASDASVTSGTTLKSLLSKPSLLSTKTTEGIFSSSPVFAATNSPKVFTTPTTTTSTIFGSKSTGSFFQTPENKSESGAFAFGSGSIFGSTTSVTKPSIFGSTTTTASIFAGSKSTGSIFGTAPSIFGGTVTTTTTSSVFATPTTTASLFKAPIFGNNNKVETPVTTTASIFKTGGSIFGGSSSTGSIFGGSPVVFGKTPEASKTIFGGGDSLAKAAESPIRPTFGATKSTEAKTTNLQEDDAAVLDCSTGVTFAALAAKVTVDALPSFVTDNNDSSTTETPFAFLGAGAPVFSSRGGNDSKRCAEEGQEGGDEEYDPHYDPIVPLPEAIVVSTGEEDEEVMFNERAKLFRFDTDSKEWKERGVGQMKILHHPVNNTYRFLLRREQVHKVVLNQLIIPDLELQPMRTSDQAWVWAGYNYTDDDSALEKLAVKFKNCDLAQTFRKTVLDVIEKVKKVQSEKAAGDHKEEQAEVKLIPSSIQNFGVEEVSGDEQAKEAYEEDDDDEDEDEDDDDDRTVMFMKRCTLSEEMNGEWKVLTLGDLQVYYDPDLYAARICITNDSGEMVSNTLIGVNTVMQIEKNNCVWKAVEWSSTDMRYRTLKATFSSTAAAQEFHCNYLEGLNYAQEFDVVDEIPGTTEEETDLDH